MKRTWHIVGMILLIAACEPSAREVQDQQNIENGKKLEWMVGDWVRSNDQLGKVTYEQWSKVSDLEYVGRGFTVNIDESIFEPETIFREELRLLFINDTLTYEVTGVNEAPTLFKFIELTDTSFVCVNPENEFPKKIAYLHKKRQMIAAISDGNQTIQFNFRRD
jgi:hypothetical protein